METTHLFDHDPHRVRFAAGQEVFAQGSARDLMYVVVAGSVEIRLDGEVIEEAGPGTLVGEMALIDDGPRTTAIVATTDAELVPVDRDRFLFLIQQTPNFALHVLRVLTARLRRMNLRYERRIES